MGLVKAVRSGERKRVGIGIVGCQFGRRVHVPAFRLDERCEIVAISASDSQRAAAAASELGIPHSFGDWRGLIEDTAVDAVSIATPPGVQGDIALEAIAQGKAVFAEKPLALTVDKARRLREAAVVARVPNVVDFSFPDIAAWRRAKEILAANEIGRLRRQSRTDRGHHRGP